MNGFHLLKVSPPLIIFQLVPACRFALEHTCMHGSCAKARLPHLGEINRMGKAFLLGELSCLLGQY